WPSAGEVGQAVFADLQLVAVRKLRRLHPLAVDEAAVEAALVLDEVVPVALAQDRVLPRHRHVVEEDAAVGRAPDGRLALESEHLSRAAAARPDDERGALDAEVLERLGRLLALLRRERLRRLGPALLPDEQGAAARAVVRGFRILEPALLAVDVTQAGGAAFEVRISVRCSTSTWSRTLWPPVFWRRGTSSARRMSIFPCSSRRW